MYQSICIIQARVNSTRLPKKVLFPLYGGVQVIEAVIQRAKKLNFDKIIIATGPKEFNSELAVPVFRNEVEIFYGDEDDVLYRFYEVSEKYPSKYITRITADNPFIDVTYTLQIQENIRRYNLDYAVMDGIPLGTACEMFTKELLDIAHKNAKIPHDREHVTSYIISNKEQFKYQRFSTDEFGEYYKLRLTIDTNHDYRRIFSIVDWFKTNDIDFRKIIHLLENNEVLKNYMMN